MVESSPKSKYFRFPLSPLAKPEVVTVRVCGNFMTDITPIYNTPVQLSVANMDFESKKYCSHVFHIKIVAEKEMQLKFHVHKDKIRGGCILSAFVTSGVHLKYSHMTAT